MNNKYAMPLVALAVGAFLFVAFFTFEPVSVNNDHTENIKEIVNTAPINTVDDVPLEENDVQNIENTIEISIPLERLNMREIKKPFALFIAPETSPVQPERFRGYHTGTDFEIFDNEIDADVMVRAICDGNVIFRNFVNGYGGVLIQDCVVDEQIVTVLYGHVNIDTVRVNVGEKLHTSDDVGLLGDDNSEQTDFERKHLHIGMHKGNNTNVQGYVQNKENLDAWADVCTVVQCANK